MAISTRSHARRHHSATCSAQRILEAAVDEFAAKGFAGARIGAIARRARVNRRMLYYYFGNKRSLFGEAVRVAARGVEQVPANTDDALAALIEWFHAGLREPRYLRLLQWEALEHRVPDPEAIPPGRVSFGLLTRLFGHGPDAQHAALLLVATAIVPLAFPQLTRTIAEQSPTVPAFARAHERWIRVLAGALAVAVDTDGSG